MTPLPRFHAVGCLALALLAIPNMGCAPEEVDIGQVVEDVYEGKGVIIAETANYVYLQRRLEDLRQAEQRDAYEYALKTVVEAVKNSKAASTIPGASSLLTKMSGIDISDTMETLEQDLEGYRDYVEENLDVMAPQVTMTPSGVIIFIGMPVTASAVVGGSGSITAMIVIKLYKVTRIDKRDGSVDDDWWRWAWDAADAAILKIGAGFGAGGGIGFNGGLGFVWGELDAPEDFRGQTASVSFVPLAGGIGPMFRAGVRWNNVTESAHPDNFYFMAGVETGVTAKAFETHVQGGNITGLWKWLASTLGFEGITKAGKIDTLKLE